MISQFDIDYAAAILRKYRKNAVDNKKEKAREEIEKVMLTFDALYQVAKNNNEIMTEEKK